MTTDPPTPVVHDDGHGALVVPRTEAGAAQAAGVA